MYIEQFLKDVETQLPKLAETADLVELGIFSTSAEAVQRRKRGESPEYIRLSSRRIVYPKNCVINWLRERASTQGKRIEPAEVL